VIQQQGATTLRDVLRNVPGITYQAGEGGGGLPGDNFTIRGFSAGNDMFVDGIRDAGGYSRDAFNLEQVEVAKGPSSSIVGRGATGGAINQVTKSPHMAESYSGSIGFGSADYGRGTLDLNQPLGNESGAALRVSAMWTDVGVPGRDVVENRSWGVAPSVAFGLTSPTQVTLKYQHLAQDNVPDYGLPWGSSPGFPTGAFQATPAVDQSNFYGLRDYDFEDIQSDLATADVAHRFSSTLSLRNTTRYSETDRDSAITAPRPPNRQLQRRTMGNGNVANQTNVTLAIGRARVRHDVVAGVEFSRETTSNQNSAQSVNQPTVSVLDPDPNDRPLGPMPDNTGNPSETRLNQAGIYLFDTLHLGERWQASGGARWDNVDVDYSQTTLTTGEVTRIESSNGMLSWRAGLVFKPKPEGSVYVGYGTSFNPSVDAAATGAALSIAPTSANNPSLDPEETRNVEVGTKWDAFESRLSLTAALFRTTKLNARTRNAASDPFVLTGEHRVQGVELGVSGTIARGWTAYAAYAFMDSAIAASANAAEEGQNLTLTPESTFNIWSTFQLPWEMTVGGGAQYMDAVFRNTTNTTSVPSYWLLNGLVSQRVTRRLTLRLNGQNLGDEEYVDRVGGGHYIPGPRRQITLNADFGF
jgi:catecholate siderophore receptor